MAFRYGRLPPTNAPALSLGRFLTGTVPAHPAAEDFLHQLSGWQMLGNDTAGDCVAVTWANTRRLVTRYLSTENYPSQAQVWVDGSAVGTTPLLLILAPGKYRIELRGVRQEHAETECALLPRETQEVVMKLQKMYPNRINTQ